jgi:snurportin-1
MKPSEECILDCVYAEDSCTYYIVDIMMWKGYDLCNCTAEFRQFWIHTKIQEDCPSGLNNNNNSSSSDSGTERVFVRLPAYQADTQGLAAAAPRTSTMEEEEEGEPSCRNHSFPFIQDGVLLLHKEGHYTAGETTPLALLWKDAACSHYYIDTDADGNIQQGQLAVLEYRHDADGTVVTADTPPIVLAQMPDQFRSSPAIIRAIHQSSSRNSGNKKVVRGRPVLLRFAIGPGGFKFHTGGDNEDCRPVGADLIFKGAANSRRGRADTLTKMLFQYSARRQPITFEDLMTAAASGSNGGES